MQLKNLSLSSIVNEQITIQNNTSFIYFSVTTPFDTTEGAQNNPAQIFTAVSNLMKKISISVILVNSNRTRTLIRTIDAETLMQINAQSSLHNTIKGNGSVGKSKTQLIIPIGRNGGLQLSKNQYLQIEIKTNATASNSTLEIGQIGSLVETLEYQSLIDLPTTKGAQNIDVSPYATMFLKKEHVSDIILNTASGQQIRLNSDELELMSLTETNYNHLVYKDGVANILDAQNIIALNLGAVTDIDITFNTESILYFYE